MAGSAWNVFSPNTKILSSKVNENNDWMEGSIVPMNAGNKTTGAYDLGESTARWKDIYLHGVVYNDNPSYVLANASGTQYIGSTTGTYTVNFGTKTIDYQGEFTTTGMYFKPIAGGVYAVEAAMYMDGASTTAQSFYVNVYDDVYGLISSTHHNSPYYSRVYATVNAMRYFAATSKIYIQVQAYPTAVNYSVYSARLSVVRLA